MKITQTTTFSISRHPARIGIYFSQIVRYRLTDHIISDSTMRASPLFSVLDCGNLKCVFLNLTKIAGG